MQPHTGVLTLLLFAACIVLVHANTESGSLTDSSPSVTPTNPHTSPAGAPHAIVIAPTSDRSHLDRYYTTRYDPEMTTEDRVAGWIVFAFVIILWAMFFYCLFRPETYEPYYYERAENLARSHHHHSRV